MKVKNSELYFTLKLTSNEHDIVEWEYIRPFCKRLGVDLIYYRQFKTGHIPMHRECKITGLNNKGLSLFLKWCETRNCPIILENYWREAVE